MPWKKPFVESLPWMLEPLRSDISTVSVLEVVMEALVVVPVNAMPSSVIDRHVKDAPDAQVTVGMALTESPMKVTKPRV